MDKRFLHVIDRDLVEVSTLADLQGYYGYHFTEFIAFVEGAQPGDVFQVQHNEYIVMLGVVTRAS